MDCLSTYASGDCLHTKSGSFRFSEISSFDVDPITQNVTLHFFDKSTKDLCESLPVSAIHRLRLATSLNQPTKTPETSISPKFALRKFFKIAGNLESLSRMCTDLLKRTYIHQSPFIQLMKFNENHSLLLLIEEHLVQDSFATRYNVVVTKMLNKRYIEQEEMQNFVEFSFNTLAQKTFNLAFLLRENVSLQEIQIAEKILEQFGPTMYFQLVNGTWGENTLHVLFPYEGQISEVQKNIWFRKCHAIGREGEISVHSDVPSVWKNLDDTRNIYDMNYQFHYNTMPIRRSEDKPIAYPDTDMSLSVSISTQAFPVDAFERIAEKIKEKFPDAHLLLFKNPAPLEALDLVVTLDQRAGVDLFAFENVVKDLGYNLNNFHVSVPSHRQSIKSRIVKKFKHTSVW